MQDLHGSSIDDWDAVGTVLHTAPADLLAVTGPHRAKYQWTTLSPVLQHAAAVLGYEPETWPYHVKDRLGWEGWCAPGRSTAACCLITVRTCPRSPSCRTSLTVAPRRAQA